ncbi:iron ABC transporter permease [Kibdelosporangium philippinense]|uniref:Iron ABC transporter permease n=1 Tax=Kibdelosporangium philippinense TaxID=211113 RepID=A0ABS8Z5S6_9PSEU|nr:iron ABC transporter permease [Kibdelosporangium philippinense]MCE7001923.1 iron ABC transporter permease [Kibdelosporangium philippinense]
MRWIVILIPLAVVLAFVQLLTGSSMSAPEALAALFGDNRIIVELRAPRVVVGLAAGACLGVAGMILQSTLRNPLASPEVTGVGSGAILGAVVATTIGATTSTEMVLLALLGGLLGGGILWAMASTRGSDPLRLAVIGVLLSATLASATLILLTARPQLAGAMTQWLVGSLNGRTWEHWRALWPCLAIGFGGAFLVTAVLSVLSVDDDHAKAVGIAVTPWRITVLMLSVLTTSAAAATTGALVFVGMLAPHAARALVGSDQRVALPLSAIIGAATVAAADIAAQHANLPAGAITAIAGAIVLIKVAKRMSAATVGGSR